MGPVRRASRNPEWRECQLLRITEQDFCGSFPTSATARPVIAAGAASLALMCLSAVADVMTTGSREGSARVVVKKAHPDHHCQIHQSIPPLSARTHFHTVHPKANYLPRLTPQHSRIVRLAPPLLVQQNKRPITIEAQLYLESRLSLCPAPCPLSTRST